MTSAQSTLVIHRNWLHLGYRAEYRLQLEPGKVYLPELTDSLLREILAPLVLSQKVVHNIKGRDRQNMLNQSIPAQLLPQEDEFFFAAGTIGRANRAQPERDEFLIAVESKYLPSAHTEMSHAPEVRRWHFPVDVDIKKLGRLMPLHLQHVRLGLDTYKSRFFSSLIGLVPTVTQTLLLEADERRCIVTIEADDLSRRTELPLKTSELLSRLSAVFEKVFGFDVLADYENKLRV